MVRGYCKRERAQSLQTWLLQTVKSPHAFWQVVTFALTEMRLESFLPLLLRPFFVDRLAYMKIAHLVPCMPLSYS